MLTVTGVEVAGQDLGRLIRTQARERSVSAFRHSGTRVATHCVGPTHVTARV
jgi:hypothetical protein